VTTAVLCMAGILPAPVTYHRTRGGTDLSSARRDL
jgi:hypothetical protein